MTLDIDLGKLSHAEKDALIRSPLPLVGQLQAALTRIAELEARVLDVNPRIFDPHDLPVANGTSPGHPNVQEPRALSL